MRFWIGIPQGVLIASLVLACALLGDAMMYAVLPTSVENFGLTVGLVGVLLSANRFVRLISNPVAAIVYDWFGIKRPMLVAIVFAVGSTTAYGLFHSFWPLLVARLVWGISFSFLRLGGYLVILEEGSVLVRGRLMGFFTAVQRSGNLVGVTIGAFLADLIGPSSTFLLFALLTSVGIPLALVHRPAVYADEPGFTPKPLKPSITMAEQCLQHEQEREKQGPTVLSPLVRWRLSALYFIRFTIAFSVSGLVMSTLGLHLRNMEGDSIQIFGMPFGIVTLTGLLLGSRWAFSLGLATHLGILSDRLGRRRILLGFSVLLPFVLVVLGMFPMLLIVALALPTLFLASVACEVSLDASVGDLAQPSFRARILGWYTTWTDLGMATGPLLGYGLVTVWGLEVVYLLASGLLAIGIVIYYLAFRLGESSH